MIISDPIRFQKVFSGVQSIVVSIAVGVGGVWGVYVFNAQRQAESAQAQLTKLNRELSENISVTAELIAESTRDRDPRFAYLHGVVKVHNRGSMFAQIFVPNDVISVAPVTSGLGSISYGDAHWVKLHSSPEQEIGTMSVFPGGTVSAVFVTRVKRPGLYLGKV